MYLKPLFHLCVCVFFFSFIVHSVSPKKFPRKSTEMNSPIFSKPLNWITFLLGNRIEIYVCRPCVSNWIIHAHSPGSRWKVQLQFPLFKMRLQHVIPRCPPSLGTTTSIHPSSCSVAVVTLRSLSFLPNSLHMEFFCFLPVCLFLSWWLTVKKAVTYIFIQRGYCYRMTLNYITRRRMFAPRVSEFRSKGYLVEPSSVV